MTKPQAVLSLELTKKAFHRSDEKGLWSSVITALRGQEPRSVTKLMELNAVATFLLLYRKVHTASCEQLCCGEYLVLQLLQMYRFGGGRLGQEDVREAIDDYESNLAWRDEVVRLHKEAEGC
jgi:hypothetical protein